MTLLQSMNNMFCYKIAYTVYDSSDLALATALL